MSNAHQTTVGSFALNQNYSLNQSQEDIGLITPKETLDVINNNGRVLSQQRGSGRQNSPIDSNKLKFEKMQLKRGRNGPKNTFGVSREEREKVLSHKYFSPPTGSYHVKYKLLDPNDKVTYFVPDKSTPERDPRFDYSKKNTLLWLPYKRELETHNIENHNCTAQCTKCIKKGDTSTF
jgi:hypothetical protein